jgi:septal ring factor EnvC (AmiA/AmiB activator)
MFVATTGDAAPAKDAAALKAEREAVRARAERARTAIAAAETQRKDAIDAVAEADRALADARKRQADAERARDDAQAARAVAQNAADDATRALRADQARLGKLLVNRHAEGSAEPVKLWLSGREPAEVARLSTWLAAIGRARAAAIERWRRDREKQAVLASAADAARRAHEATIADVAREAAAVDARRRDRQALVMRLSTDIRRQRVSLDALAKDEARLRTLLERLARPAPPKSARPPTPPSDGHRQENRTKGFGSMRNLPMPVKGELAGRFGVPREGSGAPWRGWFFETAAGAGVRAVAAGQVVWADWLRGFGNLLILDHGDGYMTLYGHNEALLPAVGAQVAAGEVIAQAGASGGAETPGVYFEVRYDGRAIDPAPFFARDAAR